MNSFRQLVTLAAGAMLIGGPAAGGVCDWRPSAMIAGGGSGAATGAAAAGAAGVGGVAAATGIGLQAAGYYTLVHSVTGLTMLASTAAGASAAGTVGIIAGTGGLIGTAAGIAMAPPAIVAGAVAAVGIGTLEGVCWFGDERVTDFDAVLHIVQSMAARADPQFFRLDYDAKLDGQAIHVRDRDSGKVETYLVRNLYIVNGLLKHRDWGRNTVIGRVGFERTDTPATGPGTPPDAAGPDD